MTKVMLTGAALLLLAPLAQAAEQKKPAPSLFGNISSIAPSQSLLGRAAYSGNRNAQSMASGLGKRSISDGLKHLKHGKHHGLRHKIRMGYLNIAQGILGIVASAKAGLMAEKDKSNSANLESVGLASSAGPSLSFGAAPAQVAAVSGSNSSGSSRVANVSNAEAWKAAARELESPELKEALAIIEEEYGLTKKDVFDDLKTGGDGQEMMALAPLNPEPKEQITLAYNEVRKSMDEKSMDMSGASAPVAISAPASSTPAATVVASAASASNSSKLRDELRARMNGRSPASEGEPVPLEGPKLSIEVQQALEARAIEEAKVKFAHEFKGEPDLFEMVHSRYLQHQKLMTGRMEASTN